MEVQLRELNEAIEVILSKHATRFDAHVPRGTVQSVKEKLELVLEVGKEAEKEILSKANEILHKDGGQTTGLKDAMQNAIGKKLRDFMVHHSPGIKTQSE